MSLDLVPEDEHAQMRVGGLVHGFGLDAHAVLLRRQLVGTLLLVPQVEKPGNWRPNHNELAPEILPVQVDVLHPPAFDLQIKPTWRDKREVTSRLGVILIINGISSYQYLGNLNDTGTSFRSQNPSRIQHLFCESV